MTPGEQTPTGSRQMLAVLWHPDVSGDVQIIGIFESPADARALIEDAHGKELFERGRYRISERPLTRSGEQRGRTWP